MAFQAENLSLCIDVLRKLERRENCLFLGDQQIYATETDFRTRYPDLVQEVSAIDLAPENRLSSLEHYREKGFVSCLMFARMFGFSRTDILDLTELGLTNVVHDLNEPGLLSKTGEVYDAVFDGGTTEHIFDVAQAFRNIGDCIRPGGVVIHQTPMNGMVNHGFYQFSPILFSEYYDQNNWEIMFACYLCEVDGVVHAYKANTAEMTPNDLEYPAATHSFLIVARKSKASTVGRVPIQRHYEKLWDNARQMSEIR